MDTDTAVRNLRDIATVLDARDAEWWLMGGTALGVWRDGTLIPFDPDTDIGLWPDTDTSSLTVQLVEAGFTVVKDYPHKIVVERDGVKTDIFMHYFENGTIRHKVLCYGKMYTFAYTPFILAPTDILGFRAWLPAPTEHYLIENYGRSWRTPDPLWSCIRDSKALVKESSHADLAL